MKVTKRDSSSTSLDFHTSKKVPRHPRPPPRPGTPEVRAPAKELFPGNRRPIHRGLGLTQ